jgi:hypothetical protein
VGSNDEMDASSNYGNYVTPRRQDCYGYFVEFLHY